MNRYTIFCTRSQTKKALELGAPIEIISYGYEKYHNKLLVHGKGWAISPTAEQMCGWLRKQGLCVEIISKKYFGDRTKLYNANLWKIPEVKKLEDVTETNDYKEATLAAIDAALKYLTSNKK